MARTCKSEEADIGADETSREVEELFNKHFRSNQSLDNIQALDALLPDYPAVLRGLGARCREESRRAMRAGHHMEGRRFDILARQLQERAEQADPRKRP